MVVDLAWRLFRHEARRGELTIILFAIVLSVSAVLSLSLFSERLQSALVERSAVFLAADAQLRARQPADASWLNHAQQNGLSTAQQVRTRSMAFGEENMSLVDLRAVSHTYPLKGTVKLADSPFAQTYETMNLPEEGKVWIDARLFQLLDVSLGKEIYVGDKTFIVDKVLGEIPDAGFSFFSSEPIVLMSLADLAAANVTGPGSRVSYINFFAGDSDNLTTFYDWLRPQLDNEIHSWRSTADDDSPIGRSVSRAEQYFLLASLLAIVLAAVSIAVAAQRYSQRHFDPVAIMKTLGASRKMVQQIFVLQILFIMALGIAIGLLVGFVIQHIVVLALADTVDVSLNVWHWRPFIIAVFTGALCAFMFSLYPLLQLFSVPPLRVLRRDMAASLSARWLQFLAAGGAIFILMWSYSGNLKISAILFISGVVLIAGLIAATYGLIALGRKLGQGSVGPWQLAWARIRRRAMDNSVQLISFSITIMLLLVVLVMRNDMVQQWRDQLPEGTPNYFLINITDADKDHLIEHFQQSDVAIDELFPVVRGRFVSVNDERVNTEITKEERQAADGGRDGLGREANLTWSTRLQHENIIVEGAWHDQWRPEANAERIYYPVSLEKEVADRLDLKLNDKLTFNVGSEIVYAQVTSLREVNWQTMQPNFFFVLHPLAMENFSPTYITSFHLETARKPVLTSLMQPFPAVSMFDVDARINQLRDIIDQVSLAVEFILILVLAAGSLVLIAQVQASMDERQQELAILRTLGAKGSLIRQSVVFEFIIIGVVAGLLAAIANELSLYLLKTQVFEMNAGGLHLDYWVIASVAGALVVGTLGAISCWRLLSLNTTTLLRRMV